MKTTKLLLVMALSMAAIVASAQLKPELKYNTQRTAGEAPITVVIPDVPASMTFAGKKIDLDRVDMAERLDRELTAIVYGHRPPCSEGWGPQAADRIHPPGFTPGLPGVLGFLSPDLHPWRPRSS